MQYNTNEAIYSNTSPGFYFFKPPESGRLFEGGLLLLFEGGLLFFQMHFAHMFSMSVLAMDIFVNSCLLTVYTSLFAILLWATAMYVCVANCKT